MTRQATAAILCCWSLVAVTALVAAGAAPSPRSVPAAPTSAPLPSPPALAPAAHATCPVTQPNGDVPPGSGNPDYVGGYGSDALWTNLWMWGEGPVRVAPDPARAGETVGPGKWAWYRYVPGRLTIEGKRLDAPAPPLQAAIPDGYGALGFQVSGISFPTPGCWEVTGRVGDASLTFVVLVVLADPADATVALP